MLQFPPFAGALDVGQAQPCTSHSATPPLSGCEVAVWVGEVEVLGSVAPKVQTSSAKNADNRVLWARWSAIWAQRRLASRGARKEPLNMRVNAFDTHVNLSKCAWAALPTRKSSGPRADQRAHARVSGPTCGSAGPRARCRAHVRVIGPACARVHSSPAPVQG